MDWARILGYIIGTVDQELLLRNEYLIAESRILKAQIDSRLRLSDAERAMLGGSDIAWAARRWRRWLTRHGPMRFWDGIGGSWRVSSMGQKRVDTPDDPKLIG